LGFYLGIPLSSYSLFLEALLCNYSYDGLIITIAGQTLKKMY